jgi:HAD superfamily hydrolase (TIGR01509 family)
MLDGRAVARVHRQRAQEDRSDHAAVDELVRVFLDRVGELRLKPGATELLDAAAGRLPLALASSSTALIIEAVLEHVALRSRFAVVVSGSAVARPKPAPDIFLRAAELLGLPARRCVAREDSPAGVSAAHAAGMTVSAVPERENGPFDARAHYVVTDLHQALRLFAWQ